MLISGNSGNSEEELSRLLEKVFKQRGWDFRNYKRTSLKRRVSKRLNALKAPSYRDYSLMLDLDPSEYARLFATLTIKVSEFFREPEVFEAVCGILRSGYPGTALKAWCCGCAYGEEAYSLAIMLNECVGPEAAMGARVFATDIDTEALEQARRAMYREDSLRNVLPEVRDKYFFESEGLYKVKYNVRNMVKFGMLDIVQGPSLSGVHLLFCRNLFIYFNKQLQGRVFGKLDYALKPGGILVLGKAEVLPGAFSDRYEPMGDRMNIYRKRV